MMIIKNKTAFFLSCVIGFSALTMTPVYASDAGAFFGGVLASKIVRNVRDQNKTEQTQTTAVPQYQTTSTASKPSAKQRIQELDKLAAGGYITPDEYKRKKQSIIDSL